MKTSTALKQWLRGIIGLLIGVIFLWLAFRQTSAAQVNAVLTQAQLPWLLVAMGCYAFNMVGRIIRWQTLLKSLKSLSFKQVGSALMVGYAANTLLPARLGELFRADFAGRRYGLSRTAVIASIVVERVLDGVAVVVCLAIGRLFVTQPVLSTLTTTGALLFGSIVLGMLLVDTDLGKRGITYLPPAIANRLTNFQQGIAIRRRAGFSRAVLYTLGIWILEGFTLWAIMKTVGVTLNWYQMLVLMGVTSLSTLLPSAPGFVGTYQFSYTFTLSLFGYEPAQAVVAAIAFQVFLFGGVTLVGLSIYLYLHWVKPAKPYEK